MTLKRRADVVALSVPERALRNDLIALAVGTLLYLVLGLVFHPLVIGHTVFGRPAF